MGTFGIEVNLANLEVPNEAEKISLLVDPRSTLSWIPRATLERRGAKPVSLLPFVFGGGTEAERETSAVLMSIGNRKAVVPVVFSELSERAVLELTAYRSTRIHG